MGREITSIGYKLFVVRLRRGIGVGVVALLWSRLAFGYPLPCNGETDQSAIAAAVTRIYRSVDPCGESPQVVALLDKLERCTATRYRICMSSQIDRNWFERPADGLTLARTVMWNPALHTPIELGCDGDPAKPVLRDATASLLHELVHAAQDCEGLDPSTHELDAVRVENIYRRAMGLCQRTRYGDQPLPPAMTIICEPDHCLCTSPVEAPARQVVVAPAGTHHVPRANAVTSADAEPGRVAP